MSETPWTPGPWVKDGIAIAHMSPPHGYPLDVCLMGEPAQYAGDTATMLQNHEANARLIAAAPDMAEVLEEISASLHQIARDRDFQETELAFMRRVDAALAKARGQA